MCSIQGILGAAGVAALAVAAGGSLYYLFRSRAQKTTTTEETALTPVEEDPEMVEERQAEPMVEPVLTETVMELVEEDGGVDCHQEEDQATLITDEAPEAPDLLVVTDPAEPEEAEATLYPELCESVVETLEEDGGVDCPQEEDQATLIMDETPEAARLLQDTDLAETEDAEVTVEPELCESVVETLEEDGGVDCPQEEDQATLITDESPEAPDLLVVTDPVEPEEAEATLYPELCESVVETVVEDGGEEVEWWRPPLEEDEDKEQPLPSVSQLYKDWPSDEDEQPKEQRQPRRRRERKITDKKDSGEEAEVTVEPELCESVVKDGKVARFQEDLATLIMKEALEAVRLQLGTDPAETEEAETKSEPKKKQRRRGTRGKGRKIKYKKDSVED